MSVLDAPVVRVVLQEGGDAGRLAPERRAGILRALLGKGYSVTCANGDGAVAPVDASELLVLREGAAGDGVADAPDGGASSSDAIRVRLRDITDLSPDDIVDLVGGVQAELGPTLPGQWKPWFPVIDYSRCTDCMQCLSFCLFDVYGVDAEKHIEVRNQDKCKTNCPACSRVCPEVAILFPKYSSGPINGDVVKAEDIEREKMKIDVSALLGGDIYSLLRERHERAATRFSKERDEGRALKERLKCLKKLGQAMDIPEEVLMALPSMDEIRSKADRLFDRRSTSSDDGNPNAN